MRLVVATRTDYTDRGMVSAMAIDDETREAIVAAVAAELDRRDAAGQAPPTTPEVAEMVQDEADQRGQTVTDEQAGEMAADAEQLVEDQADEGGEEITSEAEAAGITPEGPAPNVAEPEAPTADLTDEIDQAADEVADEAHDVAPGQDDPDDDAPMRVHPFWGFNLFDLFRR